MPGKDEKHGGGGEAAAGVKRGLIRELYRRQQLTEREFALLMERHRGR